jgi:hypothetical protein
VTAQIVQLGDQKLWRAALDLQDADGGRHRVHVYEAYWAHCTQGKITVGEAMKFLVGAAYQGVRYALWPPRVFRRFLFDRWVTFRLSSGLALLYLLALASLMSLIIVNFAVTTAASVKLLTGPGDTTSWPSYALLRDLTVDLAGLALVFGTSFVVFYTAYRRHRVNWRDAITSERRPLLRLAIWSLVALSLLRRWSSV